MTNSEIKDFAVNILGCGCEESVFSRIDITDNYEITDDITIRKRILIGERLLIYIAEAEKLRVGDLPRIVSHGLEERDSKGYNRLRVVAVSETPHSIKEKLEEEFMRIPAIDEKAHIHILSNKDVPA